MENGNAYDLLRKIIDPKVIISLNMVKRSITLKEGNPGAKLHGITLEGFSDEDKFIAFKLDYKNLPISRYLNRSQEKINRGCDAVIAAQINGKKYFFFCELKSDSPKGYKDQFYSSHAFVDYIDSLLRKFFDFSLEEFKKVYILFTSKRVPKDPIYTSAQKKPSEFINGIPLFFEANCWRGSTFSVKNIKKYVG